ncbi:MAG: hypothetical protein WD669_12130 [Pirellulales bacterium]
MPRFVLLYHDCPPGYVRPSHWDLMLESGDVLETWALFELPKCWQLAHAHTAEQYPICPPLASDDTVSAEHLAGHRLAYLDYEGPVSSGRGSVLRVAAGEFSVVSRSADAWRVALDVGPLCGELTLQHATPESATWLLTFRRI